MKKNIKKNIIIIISLLLVIIIISFVGIGINARKNRDIRQSRCLISFTKKEQYEAYLNSNIYGTDVVTLINKAISNNDANNVTKDEKGFYINNGSNSIQIDLVMITDEEKEETTTYKMETIYKVGVTEFIKNFNTTNFKCTKVEYHKQTGKIAYIELSQQ